MQENRKIFSVDHQLQRFPHISATVQDLHARGELRYIEVVDWLRGHEPYSSPEGHLWGTVGHRIVGEHLAIEVTAALAESSAAAPR